MTSNPLVRVLLFALAPALLAVAGGTLAAFRPPGPKLRSFLQHFAAGVVFSVVGVELLPDILRVHAPAQVVIGFSLGVLTMLGIRSLGRKLEGEAPAGEPKKAGEVAPESATGDDPAPPESGERRPAALIFAVGVDVLVDGLLVGIGFAAGAKEGAMLTAALSVELLSLGLATSATLRKNGAPRGRTVATIGGLAVLILIGAGLGATLLRGLSDKAMEVVLSFGLAALMFLVTEELLVEAHEEPETPLSTAMFFVGFLAFLIVGMVA